MTYADLRFKEIAEDILKNGISDKYEEVRPRWEDNTPAHTISKFGVISRYNLKEEFPITTLRRTAFKSAVDELLWIWQKKSNNVDELNSNIWNSWAAPEIHYTFELIKKEVHTSETPYSLDKEILSNRAIVEDEEIIEYFGEHLDKYCSLWEDMINEVLMNESSLSISKDFSCLTSFLRWVMDETDKELLSKYTLDNTFYDSNYFSKDTTKLLLPNEIEALSADEWYIFDDELFFSQKKLARHLDYYGHETNLFNDGEFNQNKFHFILLSRLLDSSIRKVILVEDCPKYLPRFKREIKHTIKKAYGYQLGVKHRYPEGEFDQVDRVLYDLKNNPASRRIMTNIYNHEDLSEMGLYPCAYSMTFSVKDGKLNAILNQRSQDFLTANNWNVVQYAVLVHLFAQVSNLEVGEFIHVISDCHIYDRHIPIIEELITKEPLKAPKLIINPNIKDFYDFTIDDIRLEDYAPHKGKYLIEVAI